MLDHELERIESQSVVQEAHHTISNHDSCKVNIRSILVSDINTFGQARYVLACLTFSSNPEVIADIFWKLISEEVQESCKIIFGCVGVIVHIACVLEI